MAKHQGIRPRALGVHGVGAVLEGGHVAVRMGRVYALGVWIAADPYNGDLMRGGTCAMLCAFLHTSISSSSSHPSACIAGRAPGVCRIALLIFALLAFTDLYLASLGMQAAL